ncbi:pyrimidine/purine nucleosidase domain-containing protein [Vibrio lentus]|nr:pyrimidine/purine nucleosidase domain-containing protein [Vibrio lentus]
MRRERGIKLELGNPTRSMLLSTVKSSKGIQEHLFSVLRDIVYVNMHLADNQRLNLTNATHIRQPRFWDIEKRWCTHTRH